MKHIRYGFLFLLLIVCHSTRSYAQNTAADLTVQAWATVQETPAAVTLHWLHDPHAQSYSVQRRLLGDASWGNILPVAGKDSTFVDNNAQVGQIYEYKIHDLAKGDTLYDAYGFVASGIKAPTGGDRGIVILLVDNTYAAALAPEITRLMQDLEGEGWRVVRHDVNRTDSVVAVKNLILNDDQALGGLESTLFILGHVPVPYSGDIAPDGHTPGNGNHQGAWPADVYYGQIYGDWTDDIVNDTTANWPQNRNVPGDGKFDNDVIPGDMYLQVGRVDFADLPAFSASEKDLLKQYLDRDHAFRTGALHVPDRALVNINFGVFAIYDVPGEDAWRNFPPLVGPKNVVNFKDVSPASDWFSYLDTAKYLWAYGCGPGSFNSCGGVGTTQQFAANGGSALFYMLFGSFFGDWNAENDFTRAPLATNFGLASCWASRPFWYFHPLGMGQTFGYCTKLTQNANPDATYSYDSSHHTHLQTDYVYGVAERGVHVALMGDPTLRMQYLSDPPSALSASASGANVQLSWQAAAQKQLVEGYNVYRAASVEGPFTLVTPSPITQTSWTDPSPMKDSNVYIVRATGTITTPSGTYVDESGGVMQSVLFLPSGVAENHAMKSSLTVTENGDYVTINLTESQTEAERTSVVDIAGREVKVVAESTLTPGNYSYRLDKSSFAASGIYFVRATSASGVRTAKFSVTR